MPRFERSSGRSGRPRRDRDSGAKTFEEHVSRRSSSRGSSRGPSRSEGSRRDGASRRSGSSSGGRRELSMTKVVCDSCGNDCEVPFKPTSNKPVYCSDCFEKNGGKSSSSRSSDRAPSRHSEGDLDVINEKLNKIMKALKIK